MDVERVTEKIVESLEAHSLEYDYEGIRQKLLDNPDIIYDRLIELGRRGNDSVHFYALAEIVVDYEKEHFPPSNLGKVGNKHGRR